MPCPSLTLCPVSSFAPRALSLSRDVSTLNQAAVFYHNLGRHSRAIELFHEARDRDPADDQVVLHMVGYDTA